jgi:hypothetical protein
MTDIPADLAAEFPLLAGKRACRVCGCTPAQACVDPEHGPCWWLAPDLCSHCGEPAIVLGQYRRLQDITRARQLTDTELGELFDWTAKAATALQRVLTINGDVTLLDPRGGY